MGCREEREAVGDVRILNQFLHNQQTRPNTGLLIPSEPYHHANSCDPHSNQESSEKSPGLQAYLHPCESTYSGSSSLLRRRDQEAEMIFQWRLLLMFSLLLRTGLVVGCVCPAATILSHFPSEVPAGICCLNYSGSALSHVRWSVFTNGTNIETLDLSNCNISFVDMSGKEASALQRVYLGRNRLTHLPREFLAGQPSLVEVDLSENQLQELPVGFLQDSDNLQKLYLHRNQLQFLPYTVLQKSSLQRLEVEGNPWDCSCSLLEALELGRKANRTTTLQDLLGNFTCFFPRHLTRSNVWSVRISDVCRPAGLTALFIVLPLLILTALVLCWCCGRKRKRKDMPVFSPSKKKESSFSSNGQKHHSNHPPPAAEQSKTGCSISDVILKNELLLRPASTLLGSTRDIFEEVDIKLDSAESLPQVLSHCSSSTEGRLGSQEPNRASKTELDTVSVTEVMKDSTNREKAYLTQSTKYYSLVPDIELEDSDHEEYEDVDLS